MRSNSLTQDLADAVRSAWAGEGDTRREDRLSILEDEHQLLSARRRRLQESIDLLEGFAALRPDAAARLEKYKITEREISLRHRYHEQEISELRANQPA